MKPFKTILFLFGSCLCFFTLQAQSNWLDSVKNKLSQQKDDTNKVWTLVALCEYYSFSFPDTSSIYGQQAYSLADKLDYDLGRLYAVINLNSALYALGNYSLELEYGIKLIPLAKRMNNIYATGFSNGAVGDAYASLGDYATALNYYKVVLNIGETNKLPELHRMYSLICPIFVGLKKYDSAIYYANKGYELYIGSRYLDSNLFEKNLSQSVVYLGLAKSYAALNIVDSALKYFTLSIPPSETLSMKYNWIDGCNGMAQAYKDCRLFDSAIVYVRKILNEKNLGVNPIGRQQAAKILADIYEEMHSNDSAIK